MTELATVNAPEVLGLKPDLACVRLSIVNWYLAGSRGAAGRS